MPLNLNSDKLIIVVKPDQTTYIYTGATTQLANVGSGEEIYKGLVGTTSELRTLVAGNNMTIEVVGDTLRFDAGVTGGTFNMIGSGATVVTHPSGNTWVVYTPSGATGDFVTTVDFNTYSGTTAPNQFLNINALDGYWNSGQTVAYVTGHTPTLDGYWNSGQTVGYINAQGYLTGFTVTAPMVTGITHSLYAPIIHYHPQYLTGFTVTQAMVTGITASLYLPINGLNGYWNSGQTVAYVTGHTPTLDGYWTSAQTTSYVQGLGYITGLTWNDLQDKPTLFSGDYDDLSNKPDLSLFQPVSGMSIYLTGVTWNTVTLKPELTLQADFTGHTSNQNIHYPMSGISITESQISDLKPYLTGVTWNDVTDKPTLFTGNTFVASGGTQLLLVGNELTIYSPTGGTGGSVAWNDITDKPDLTLSLDFTGHTGNTDIHFEMNQITGFTTTTDFNTYTGDTQTALDGKSDTGHTHPQYLTGFTVTCDMVTGCTDGLYAPVVHTHAISGVTGLQTALDGKATSLATIKVVTGTTYTLLNVDLNTVIEFTNVASTTVNLPSGLTVGFQCNLVNIGGQIITLTKTNGGTLKTIGNFVKVQNQYGGVWVYLRATNDFLVQGDLS